MNPTAPVSVSRWTSELAVADMIATTHAILGAGQDDFRQAGLQDLNRQCLALLDLIARQFLAATIDEPRALRFFAEWLGVLRAKWPDYLTTLHTAVARYYRQPIDAQNCELTRNLFVITFYEYVFPQTTPQPPADAPSENTEFKQSLARYLQTRQLPKKTSGRRLMHCTLSPAQQEALYTALLHNGFLHTATTPADFLEVFSPATTPMTKPVFWTGSTIHLAYLFYELEENYQKISGNWQTHLGEKRRQAFVSRKGIPVTTSSLSSCISLIKHPENPESRRTCTRLLRPLIDQVLKGGTSPG